MGSGPQFIDIPETERGDLARAGDRPLTFSELRTLYDGCGSGDPNKARYADMLARASGLYAPDRETGDPIPDKELCARVSALLAPALGVGVMTLRDALAGVLGTPQGVRG